MNTTTTTERPDNRPHMAFEVIEALENFGFDHRSYSGRSMYGRQCFAITGNDVFENLFRIGQALHADDALPAPKLDNMGRGFVFYWPGFRYPTETEWKEYHVEMGTDA